MRFVSVSQAVALALLASCNPLTQACTLMGCENGLAVHFDRVPTGAYRVEAWSELRMAAQVFECAAGEACAPVFFRDFQGGDITVRVTTATGTVTREFADVEYEGVYPNGEHCGAVCEQARVTVQM